MGHTTPRLGFYAPDVGETNWGNDVAPGVSAGFDAADAAAEILSNKGAASGYAPLDSSSLLPFTNIPTWVLNMQTPASSPITGNSAEQTLFTYTLPGNTLGAGRGLDIRWRTYQNGSTSTTYRFYFGSTVVLQGTSTNNQLFWHGAAGVFNKVGLTNAQVATLLSYSSISANFGLTTSLLTDSAIDTTADVIIKLTFQVANTVTVDPTFWLVRRIW